MQFAIFLLIFVSQLFAEKRLTLTTGQSFEVYDKLGQGGFSVVYKALNLNTDRIVALKFFPKNWTARIEVAYEIDSSNEIPNESFIIQRFSAGKIKSFDSKFENFEIKSAVGVIEYEYASENLFDYITSQRIPHGQDLSQAQIPEMISVISQIHELTLSLLNLWILSAQKKIIHGDVKLTNIMRIERTGQLKLADLTFLEIGVRRFLSGERFPQNYYISPEVRGRQYQADIFYTSFADFFSYGHAFRHLICGLKCGSSEFAIIFENIMSRIPLNTSEGQLARARMYFIYDLIDAALQTHPQDRLNKLKEMEIFDFEPFSEAPVSYRNAKPRLEKSKKEVDEIYLSKTQLQPSFRTKFCRILRIYRWLGN